MGEIAEELTQLCSTSSLPRPSLIPVGQHHSDVRSSSRLLLQSSDFLVDEEAVLWFLDELLERMLAQGMGTNEYTLRSRVVPPPDKRTAEQKPAEVHHSLVARYSARKQHNGQVCCTRPSCHSPCTQNRMMHICYAPESSLSRVPSRLMHVHAASSLANIPLQCIPP